MTPFEVDPTSLTDPELDQKIQELTKKYFIAHKLKKYEVLTQLGNFVNMYKEEQIKRNISKSNGAFDKDLDNLINVD
jgi:hypothetical protein